MQYAQQHTAMSYQSRFKAAFFTLLALSLLTACPGQSDQPQDKAASSAPGSAPSHGAPRQAQRMLRAQSSPAYRVNYIPEPDPIPLNQHFRLRLQVQQADGRPLPPEQAQSLSITVDASMPEHNHGMNVKPQVKTLAPGQFEVQGLLFHMAGYWEIEVQIQNSGNSERVIFGVELEHKATTHDSHQGH